MKVTNLTSPVLNGQEIVLGYFTQGPVTLRQQTLACLDSYLRAVGGLSNVVVGNMARAAATIGPEAHKQFFLPVCTFIKDGVPKGLYLTNNPVPKSATAPILAEKGISASRLGSGVVNDTMAKMTTGFITESDSFSTPDECVSAQLHFVQTYLGGAAAWITKTGGKGSHLAVGYTTPVQRFGLDGITETPEWRAHVRCHSLSLVVLRADAKSRESVTRKLMRVPGVVALGRNQALVYHNDAQVTPFQLQAAFEAAAQAAGFQITDEALASYEIISKAQHKLEINTDKLDSCVDRTLFKALSDELLTFNGNGAALAQAHAITTQITYANTVRQKAQSNPEQVDAATLTAASKVFSWTAISADHDLVAAWCVSHGLGTGNSNTHHTTATQQDRDWVYTPVPGDTHFQIYGNQNSFITLDTVFESHIISGTKVVCPHCGKDAKLFIHPNEYGPGTPMISCWHVPCNHRYLKQEIYQVESVAPTNGDGTYYNQTYLGKTWNELKYSTTKYLDPASISSDRFLTAMLTPCGGGKTTTIRAHTASQKAIDPDQTVLVVGHRITLVRALQNIGALYGMKCYLDYPEGTPIPFTDMAITLDSLRRIQMPVGNHHGRLTLIFDEIEALFQHIFSDTLLSRQSAEETIEQLRTWIAAADKIIVSDANLSPITLEQLFMLLPDDHKNDCELIFNDGASIHHVRNVELADPSPEGLKQQRQQLHDDLEAGKKLICLYDTKAAPTSAERVLEVDFPDKKFALVTSDTSETVRDHLYNANEWLNTEGFDCLLASPSLTSGVSIDNYFDGGYIECGSAGSNGLQEIGQQVGRERQPKDNLIRIYISNNQRSDLPLTLDGCRNLLLYRATEEAARLPNFLTTYINGYWTPRCPLTVEFMALGMLQHNLNHSNLYERFLKQAPAWGLNVIVLPKPEAPTTEFSDDCVAQAKEDKQQEIDEFAAAEPLLRDWSPVDEIMGIEPFVGDKALDVETAELVMRSSGATKQQKFQARKTKALDKIPREFLDPNNEANVLKAVVHGKGRIYDTIKTASLLLAYMHNSHAEFAQAVARQAKKLKETSHVKPLFTKAQSAYQILTAFTVTEEAERYKLDENAGTAAQVTAAIGALRRVGFKVNGGSRGALGTIQDALKLCGIKLTIERANDQAKTITGIYLDKSAIQNLQALTSIYRRRLVGVQNWTFETINLPVAA